MSDDSRNVFLSILALPSMIVMLLAASQGNAKSFALAAVAGFVLIGVSLTDGRRNRQ
jgi:hypothetical protein